MFFFPHNREIHVSAEEAELLKVHPCSFCGKRFRSKPHLKQHENAHKGIKNYTCPTCNRKFTWGSECKSQSLVQQEEIEVLLASLDFTKDTSRTSIGELRLRLIAVSPYRGESLKFRLLFRIFGKFCEKKARLNWI